MFNEMCDLSLNNWYILIDPENSGKQRRIFESIPGEAVPCRIPCMIQQYFPAYHGVAFYWCAIDEVPSADENSLCFLRFEGVDYKAEVWLDGAYLGSHEGAEAPFAFEVSKTLAQKKSHLLCVRVVNPAEKDIDGLNLRNIPARNKSLVPTAGSGFNCGGIWYGVQLVRLPGIYTQDCLLKGDISSGILTAQLRVSSPATAEAEISLSVSERNGSGLNVAFKKETVSLCEGANDVVLRVQVEHPKLWSVDDPNLYRVEIRVDSTYGTHSAVRSFGFREFRLRDGFFELNGKRLFLKCSHTGNNFPIGMMFPADPALLRSDLIFAKDAGFNMIRSIAGVLRPEQLDICDEIGLMVYEECYAAWCVGYGCNAPIGDEEKMRERFRVCTLDMIRRDKNHPCLTVWGLLNESPNDVIFKEAVDFLPRVVEADGTRLVMLNAGRFDNRLSIGSCANPGSTRWENRLGIDGTNTDGQTWSCPDTIGGSLMNAGDYHMYPRVPMSERYIRSVRELGKGCNPVFYSETGIGSLFHVIEETRMFEQAGVRDDLEDFAWVRRQSEDFTRDFHRFGLGSTFASPEALLKESQRLHSAERTEIFNLIRSNPRISGYSLTGFLDHGMCGEGLISLFRRPKPEIFDALKDGWAPLRFCLFSSRNAFAGQRYAFEAVLANENALRPGRYTADFAVVSEEKGVLWRTSAEFEIPAENPFAVSVGSFETDISLEAGQYRLMASLRSGGAPTGCIRPFTVTETRLSLAGKAAALCGEYSRLSDFAAEHGLSLSAFTDASEENVIVCENLTREDALLLRKKAEQGARILFLSPAPFQSDSELVRILGLPADLRCADNPDWLYHKECAVTYHPAFDGFAKGLASFPVFGYSFPGIVYETAATPSEAISPAFHTGYHAVKGGYGSFHALCSFGQGKGTYILCCYKLLENLSKEPAAQKLLFNLLNMIG